MLNKRGQVPKEGTPMRCENLFKARTCLNQKKGQVPKEGTRTCLNQKRGQEEMVGFAFIIVIVAVVAIILLGIVFRGGGEEKVVESYKVENFLLALTSHTTDCTKNTYYKTIGELITEGINKCDDKRITYVVLENTISDIVNQSWMNIGTSKGYLLNVTYQGNEIFSINEGNFSLNNQGSHIDLNKGYEMTFVVYS